MILLGFQEPKLMYGGFGSHSACRAQLASKTALQPIAA